jgi:hypothetical protein
METAGVQATRMHRAGKAKGHAGLALATAGAIFALLAALVLPPVSLANNVAAGEADNKSANLADNVRTFTVDVALGVHYYQNSKDPAETAPNPAAFSEGDTFFQDGAVYPEGTIPRGHITFDPDTPGAIGTYKVRGTWITDLENFENAVAHRAKAAPEMAFATEILTFGNERDAIMTDGPYPNAYFSARRVVLGGTGRFRGVVGEVEMENIGDTDHGCNFRLKFKIRRAGNSGER